VPEIGIYIGVGEPTGRVSDTSPAGHEALAAAGRVAIARLEQAEPVDDIDRVTRTDLLAELRLAQEAHDARLHLRDLNVIASPAQELREVFDLMPTATADDWGVIAE